MWGLQKRSKVWVAEVSEAFRSSVGGEQVWVWIVHRNPAVFCRVSTWEIWVSKNSIPCEILSLSRLYTDFFIFSLWSGISLCLSAVQFINSSSGHVPVWGFWRYNLPDLPCGKQMSGCGQNLFHEFSERCSAHEKQHRDSWDKKVIPQIMEILVIRAQCQAATAAFLYFWKIWMWISHLPTLPWASLNLLKLLMLFPTGAQCLKTG